jgi:cytochrome c oxidase cbb3-type subunit I/II
MPSYQWLLEEDLDFEAIAGKVAAMAALGTPYDEELERAEEMARAQARAIAALFVEQAEDEAEREWGRTEMADKKVTAMIAYLLRLGTDISQPAPEPATEGIAAAD